MSKREQFVAGSIWRRKKTGALLRITRAEDMTSDWNPATFFDISWETVEKPRRRGQSYEDYWLRNCEPVTDWCRMSRSRLAEFLIWNTAIQRSIDAYWTQPIASGPVCEVCGFTSATVVCKGCAG